MFPHGHSFRIFFILALVFLLSSCSLKPKTPAVDQFPGEIIRLEKLARESEDPSRRAESRLRLAWLSTHYQNPQPDYGRALGELEAYSLLAPPEAQVDEIRNWIAVLRELQRVKGETASLKAKIESLAVESTGQKESLERQVRTNQGLQASLERMHTRLESLQETHRVLNESNQELQARLERMRARLEGLEETNLQLKEISLSLKDSNERLKDSNERLKESNESLKDSYEKLRETIEKLKMLDQQMEERRRTIK